MSWELPALTLLSLSAVGFWGLGSPQPFHRKAFYILVSASAVLVDPRQLAARMYAGAHGAIIDYQLDALFAQHFKMALTFGAVLWLAPLLFNPQLLMLSKSPIWASFAIRYEMQVRRAN
jgi:hypothetical protein